MEEIIKRYLRKIYYNFKTCALWLFMAVLTGVAVGAFSSAFSFCLKKVTTLRGQYPFLLYFLPIGGVVIVFLYHLCGVRQDKGTNIIMTAVHGKNQDVPAYMAPLIFAATIITHLFGGSAGREGDMPKICPNRQPKVAPVKKAGTISPPLYPAASVSAVRSIFIKKA